MEGKHGHDEVNAQGKQKTYFIKRALLKILAKRRGIYWREGT